MARQESATVMERSNCWFNVTTVISWVFFSVFMLTQPWLANWANNKVGSFRDKHTLYNITKGVHFSMDKFSESYGRCTIPAAQYVCTDGSNFTELALKYRPNHPFACGCGEGFLGEGLCPRTSYGHTLSDFVSTAPALGAMLGFAIFPLMGTRQLMNSMITQYDPPALLGLLLYGSLNVFQINFIFWGICSICIYPLAHAVLTLTFLSSFIVFALTVLFMFHQHEKKMELEQKVIFGGAIVALFAIVLGAIPRIFLVVDEKTFKPIFSNLNNGGFGSYAFWFGEVVGLSVFFGLYPLVFLSKFIDGEATWHTRIDGSIDGKLMEVDEASDEEIE